MSTTTVLRGLQSCLDPQLIEPLTLRLKLAPYNSHSPQPITQAAVTHVSDSESEEPELYDYIGQNNSNSNTPNGEFGGWSFIESLTKEANEEKETPYVHPLDKRSLSTLSNKSLELCTESLGSETGSDIGDDNDMYNSSSSSDSESRKSPTRVRSRFCHLPQKKTTRRSFPPPLTSISGSDYVQFTPHREGGRLVIKAVTIASTPTCFEAERAHGRLRLHLAKNHNNSDEDTDSEKKVQEQVHYTCLNEKKNGNTCTVESEKAIVKYQRPCRYRDNGHGNKSLLNWKPFLGVAI
ncbi:hypothetical protein IFM89_002713 [Coptis chinensis]|uniref:FAF domain-containing protein n=1 Tax=Coptis chinensis TaxID=261450 RepID=A0A835IH37_9MAGN|nr:hypothetical protein IFM89_002713 [Coptis chinensis]